MSKNRVDVVGGIGVAVIHGVARLPQPGETVTSDVVVDAGGKAVNHALGLAVLGCSVRMISAVGDDAFGSIPVARLTASGVDVGGVVTLPGVATLVGSVLVDSEGRNCIAVGTGAAGKVTAADVAGAGAGGGSACLVSLEMSLPAAAAALAAARARGALTVLDPAPAPPREMVAELLACADWVTPNEEEAAVMTGLPDPRAAAEALHAAGARNVVVTMGSGGALWVGDAGHGVVHGLAADVVDTTGAGDAFAAGLVSALLDGASAPAAIAHGCTLGAITVQHPGFFAALPHWPSAH